MSKDDYISKIADFLPSDSCDSGIWKDYVETWVGGTPFPSGTKVSGVVGKGTMPVVGMKGAVLAKTPLIKTLMIGKGVSGGAIPTVFGAVAALPAAGMLATVLPPVLIGATLGAVVASTRKRYPDFGQRVARRFAEFVPAGGPLAGKVKTWSEGVLAGGLGTVFPARRAARKRPPEDAAEAEPPPPAAEAGPPPPAAEAGPPPPAVEAEPPVPAAEHPDETVARLMELVREWMQESFKTEPFEFDRRFALRISVPAGTMEVQWSDEDGNVSRGRVIDVSMHGIKFEAPGFAGNSIDMIIYIKLDTTLKVRRSMVLRRDGDQVVVILDDFEDGVDGWIAWIDNLTRINQG